MTINSFPRLQHHFSVIHKSKMAFSGGTARTAKCQNTNVSNALNAKQV